MGFVFFLHLSLLLDIITGSSTAGSRKKVSSALPYLSYKNEVAIRKPVEG